MLLKRKKPFNWGMDKKRGKMVMTGEKGVQVH